MSVPVVDTALLHALRTDFEACGFSVDAVSDLLGEGAHSALHREQRLPALRRARRENNLLATMIRLFVLADEVPACDVEAACAHTTVEGLHTLGLVQVGELVRATVQIQPHEATFNDETARWWVASDLGEALTGTAPSNDHVLGIGGATRTLLSLTPRSCVETALDLGTGCGILALYLARHAERVIATDLSARACAFARFNAALNRANIEVRKGSLFDPVADEQFDLIVSNPPFVITPDTLREEGLVTYRDAGRAGDTLVADVVRGAVAHLTAHGRAFILGNWEVPEGEVWDAHPRTWLEDQPAHAWVIERESLDPNQYIEMWMRDNAATTTRTHAEFETAYAAWLRDFDARSVLRIGLGIIALQNTTETPHQKFSRITTSTSAGGDYLDRVLTDLAEYDWKIGEDDVFVRADDVREERHYMPGEADPQIIIATQGDGFGQRLQLDTHAAAALGVCDGDLAMGQIITAISVIAGVERDEVARAVLGRFPDLVAAGMIRRI